MLHSSSVVAAEANPRVPEWDAEAQEPPFLEMEIVKATSIWNPKDQLPHWKK